MSTSTPEPSAHEYSLFASRYLRGRGGFPRDFERAAHYYDLAAQLGDVDALYQLGKLYLKGVGCIRDEGGAVSCFENAANRGHTAAARKLAACFRSGAGAPISEELARYWELKAQAMEQSS